MSYSSIIPLSVHLPANAFLASRPRRQEVIQSVSSASGTNAGPKLDDILRTLSCDGRDTLVKALQQAGSVKAARIACRALRDAVDGSIHSLRLIVCREDQERVEAGECFPLSRWPQLHSLDVFAEAGSADNCMLLTVPFLFQQPVFMQRIRNLRLEPDSSISPWKPAKLQWTDDAAAAMSMLFSNASGLRRLELCMLLPRTPLQQRLLYGALASLQHLEELQLRGSFVLPRLDMLPISLKRLKLDMDLRRLPGTEYERVPEFLSWFQRFHVMQELELNTALTSFPEELFNFLPLGLQRLKLCTGLEDIMLMLECGRIKELSVKSSGFFDVLSKVADFWHAKLRGCRPLGRQRLQRLRFARLELGLEEAQPDEVQQAEIAMNLRTLAEMAERVEVGDMHIYCSDGVHLPSALMAVTMLGTPRRLLVSMCMYSRFITVDLQRQQQPHGYAAAAAGPAALTPPAPHRDWAATDGSQMARLISELVLQRLLAASTSVTASSSSCFAVRFESPSAFSKGAAMEQADIVVQAVLSSLSDPEDVPQRAWCLPLTGSAAMLLECRSWEVAAALAAAGREALAQEGVDREVSVQVHVFPGGSYVDSLYSQAVQWLWDSGVGGCEEARLRLLVGLCCELAQNPPCWDIRPDPDVDFSDSIWDSMWDRVSSSSSSEEESDGDDDDDADAAAGDGDGDDDMDSGSG